MRTGKGAIPSGPDGIASRENPEKKKYQIRERKDVVPGKAHIGTAGGELPDDDLAPGRETLEFVR